MRDIFGNEFADLETFYMMLFYRAKDDSDLW